MDKIIVSKIVVSEVNIGGYTLGEVVSTLTRLSQEHGENCTIDFLERWGNDTGFCIHCERLETEEEYAERCRYAYKAKESNERHEREMLKQLKAKYE